MSNDRLDGADDSGTPRAEGEATSGGEWWDQPDAEEMHADGAPHGGDVADGAAPGAEDDAPTMMQPAVESTNSEDTEYFAAAAAEATDSEEEDEMADEEAATNPKRQILAWLGMAVVLIMLLPVVVFGVAYVSTNVPEPEELANSQIAVIYDRTGETEITRIVPEGGNRSNIDIAEVPDAVRNAVLAAEDRRLLHQPRLLAVWLRTRRPRRYYRRHQCWWRIHYYTAVCEKRRGGQRAYYLAQGSGAGGLGQNGSGVEQG